LEIKTSLHVTIPREAYLEKLARETIGDEDWKEGLGAVIMISGQYN
jgi:hypothetical protein